MLHKSIYAIGAYVPSEATIMFKRFLQTSGVLLMITSIACNAVNASVTAIPDPVVDAPPATVKGEQIAVLAGGCFWGVEAVFEHVKGVNGVRSGYAGGSANSANYGQV